MNCNTTGGRSRVCRRHGTLVSRFGISVSLPDAVLFSDKTQKKRCRSGVGFLQVEICPVKQLPVLHPCPQTKYPNNPNSLKTTHFEQKRFAQKQSKKQLFLRKPFLLKMYSFYKQFARLASTSTRSTVTNLRRQVAEQMLNEICSLAPAARLFSKSVSEFWK